jgi:hypothetical protein
MLGSKLVASLALAGAVLLVPQSAFAQEKPPEKKIDLTGKWLFSVTTDAGTGTPTVTLKQVGDTLTGHYSSQTLGEADLKGTVKDGKLTFTFRTEVQGTALTVNYAGTVESNDALKGTVDISGLGTGTFTAKRQP